MWAQMMTRSGAAGPAAHSACWSRLPLPLCWQHTGSYIALQHARSNGSETEVQQYGSKGSQSGTNTVEVRAGSGIRARR